MNDEKHFSDWLELKEVLHKVGRQTGVTEGQIWWAAVGENVGVEINGKSKKFSRPVLIFKKLSKFGFMAIPLTTQDHGNRPWYVKFEFQGKVSFAALAQARIMSVSRLYDDHSIGKLSREDFNKVRTHFRALYCPK